MTLLLINALACGATCIRLLLFRRNGARHRSWANWLAYGLIVCTGSVALRIVMGVYNGPVDISETGINCVLCAAVFAARGNVADLFRPAINTRWLGRLILKLKGLIHG